MYTAATLHTCLGVRATTVRDIIAVEWHHMTENVRAGTLVCERAQIAVSEFYSIWSQGSIVPRPSHPSVCHRISTASDKRGGEKAWQVPGVRTVNPASCQHASKDYMHTQNMYCKMIVHVLNQ